MRGTSTNRHSVLVIEIIPEQFVTAAPAQFVAVVYCLS